MSNTTNPGGARTVRMPIPTVNKVPLTTFINNLNVPGMTQQQAAGVATAIQSGRVIAPMQGK